MGIRRPHISGASMYVPIYLWNAGGLPYCGDLFIQDVKKRKEPLNPRQHIWLNIK